MSYPTYREDFEGGSTIGTACPELVDFDSAYAIDTSGSNALTGTHALRSATTASHTISSSSADTLSGGTTFTAYMKNGSSNASLSLFSHMQPTNSATTTDYIRFLFGATGIQLNQEKSSTVTTINTPISGVTLPTGVWLALELRCNGTTISARVVRQDNGQFFVNSGSGSWSSTPQTESATTALTPAAGSWGFRGGDNLSLYLDDWIIEPAVPSIDNPSFTINGAGNTQQLTAGGFH
jgi:hypothetical protein